MLRYNLTCSVNILKSASFKVMSHDHEECRVLHFELRHKLEDTDYWGNGQEKNEGRGNKGGEMGITKKQWNSTHRVFTRQTIMVWVL